MFPRWKQNHKFAEQINENDHRASGPNLIYFVDCTCASCSHPDAIPCLPWKWFWFSDKSPLPTRFGTNLNNWTSINVFLKNNVWQSFDRVWIMKAVKSNQKNAIDSLEVNSLFSFTNMAESWCVKTALTCYFFCSDLEKQKIVQPNTRHQLCDCSHQVALLNDFFLEKMHMTKKETPATCTNKCVYFHGSVIFWTGNTTSSEPTCPLSLSLRCE